jgi:hypothetical protein
MFCNPDRKQIPSALRLFNREHIDRNGVAAKQQIKLRDFLEANRLLQ